jgi:hypothetical protein
MKLQFPTRLVLSLIVLSVLIFSMIGFQVRQANLIVLTRFRQPVRVIDQPGLYFKWPWPIECVNRFDGRLQFFESRISEALTRDKRNVIIMGPASGEVGVLTTGEGAGRTSWESVGLTTGEGAGRTSSEGVGLNAGEGVGRASGEVAGLTAGVGRTSGKPVPADKMFSFPVDLEGDEGSTGDVSLAAFTLFGSVRR